MKKLALTAAVFFCLSCASLPKLGPAGGAFDCPSPFLTEKTRLIHAIEARVSGRVQSVIGVTLADPAHRSLSVAILTAEGLVVFQAESGPGGILVSRALPPFDAGDFARSMMSDIELIFFWPQGDLSIQGVDAQNRKTCRFEKPDGDFVDVIDAGEGTFVLRRYLSGGAKKRDLTIKNEEGRSYEKIHLQAFEGMNYSLSLTLLEAEAVSTKPARQQFQETIHEKSSQRP